MGLFDRLSTLLRSNINDLISRAEDPEKMLNQILVDMRSQLAKAKQQVATAIADEKRLRDQADAEYRQAQDWEKRAVLALQENREDLAKQALMRQGEHMSHAQQLEQTWESHRLETEKLKNSLRDLNDKIEEAKRKKNLLVARQRRAQAQKRIEKSERQLKASVEIEEEFTGDALANQFKQLERGAASTSIDVRLMELKQKMGMLPASAPPDRRQLGTGGSGAGAQHDEEEVHAEVEDTTGDKKES